MNTLEKNINTLKQKPTSRPALGGAVTRVDHEPPPETSSAAETRRKTSEPSKNPKPHPGRQAVTHTRWSRERLP
jgi:hypothetical protein